MESHPCPNNSVGVAAYGARVLAATVTQGLTTPASQNRACRGPRSAPGLGSFAPPGLEYGWFDQHAMTRVAWTTPTNGN
jgi:hypothetical protein